MGTTEEGPAEITAQRKRGMRQRESKLTAYGSCFWLSISIFTVNILLYTAQSEHVCRFELKFTVGKNAILHLAA